MLKLRPELAASTAARKARSKGSPEDRLHRAVASYLSLALHDDECLWWHCPNGEYRSPKTAAKLKAFGVRPGVPDICLILPGGTAGFIELKAEKGVLSPTQKAFSLRSNSIGAKWAVCRSLEEVAITLNNWGVPLHATLFNNQICKRLA
ncbi:hypothetical protein CU669_15165 [Paramagnetospirillum kuznetsovii]|uniref:VRR-NUC domain-containing protein n=1 Tax=Paramagnetospirillum kuznetsovii TaxID=2053833 RepID=A0A364NVK8_9PROT|nr:VRR-NUC domain-containing protein [Paramagnetospirillum kuznetsovii]RAU21092.1 hypothetical protein CU669_15165 [Paramagnetospirillum kuznetsovii]